MIGRDLARLKELRDYAERIERSLLHNGSFQHERISLSIGEALKHAAHAKAWLDDAAFIAEAELVAKPGRPNKE